MGEAWSLNFLSLSLSMLLHCRHWPLVVPSSFSGDCSWSCCYCCTAGCSNSSNVNGGCLSLTKLKYAAPFIGFHVHHSRDYGKTGFAIPCHRDHVFHPERGEEEDKDGDQLPRSKGVLAVEKCSNGVTKRYVLDDCLPSVAVVEEHSPTVAARSMEAHSEVKVSWLPRTVKDFILPADFPGSVSDDYLEYMILQFPTNVTGWICHTLVTSSLLKAVGVTSVSGTSAAASTAAIRPGTNIGFILDIAWRLSRSNHFTGLDYLNLRWVSKDGLGALGRLFVGGRFGTLFDDDPKQWRMYADFIGSSGSIFELATLLYPSYFLPLASVGNLTKALARGFKDPSFRVIQNHFAISGNLGEVAAKEEVWEVAAQLLGLTFGILLLGTPGLVTSYPMLVGSWLSLRLLHLWLRYQSLMTLQFPTINLKRARILVKSHVLHSIVPGCAECNKEENILIHQSFLKPQILFGTSLSEIIGIKCSVDEVKSLLELYNGEDYILSVNLMQSIEAFKVLVSFKAGATSVTVLRSIWQAYWLCEHWEGSSNVLHQLFESHSKLEERFDDFLRSLEDAGWDMKHISIKVPTEFIIYVPNAI